MAAHPFERALVIRGGALGDFLLTLPVLAALRDAGPTARLEVLAYPGIARLATAGGLVEAARSIEYGPLAGFFTRGTVLDPELRDYFASFDLVISYLYDPDGIFAENLRAAGVDRLVPGPSRPGSGAHAIDQLARPLAGLGLPLVQRAVRLNFDTPGPEQTLLALHPGSGSPAKNWPAAHWQELTQLLLDENPDLHVALIFGEADTAAAEALTRLEPSPRLTCWRNLPLEELARRLTGCRAYLGHDTGISHLAAAVGLPGLLLFGPTDPGVWAPPHDGIRVLRAPDDRMESITVTAAHAAARSLLRRAGLASTT